MKIILHLLIPIFIFSCEHMNQPQSAHKLLKDLESTTGGRLGVYALDTTNQKFIGYREQERFPFCSTFKALLASLALKQSMQDEKFLEKKVFYGQEDIEKAGYKPVTAKNIDKGMTISELCAATIQYSDNAAANLLFKETGGLVSLNNFIKSLGDASFRIDRIEPDLNTAIPEDLRDTTTPFSMAKTLEKLVLSDALSASRRQILQDWLKGNTTGGERIRAGVPAGWVVGDKTGTGDYGTTNDIGVVWNVKGEPIVLAIYYTQKDKDAKPNSKIIAEATKIVLQELGR